LPLAACVIFLIHLCPELEYIRILDAELYRRAEIKSLEKRKEPEEDASKPEVKQHIIPREKPTHPLTTYRGLYSYAVHPWDFDKQRTIKCYSVERDKYGFMIKIPCKEKEQSQ
jgi:hypothetical protein